MKNKPSDSSDDICQDCGSVKCLCNESFKAYDKDDLYQKYRAEFLLDEIDFSEHYDKIFDWFVKQKVSSPTQDVSSDEKEMFEKFYYKTFDFGGGMEIEQLWKYFSTRTTEAYLKGKNEPHETENGYCCACGYDIACFEGNIEDAIQSERTRMREVIEVLKQHPEAGTENYSPRLGYNQALSDLLLSLDEK